MMTQYNCSSCNTQCRNSGASPIPSSENMILILGVIISFLAAGAVYYFSKENSIGVGADSLIGFLGILTLIFTTKGLRKNAYFAEQGFEMKRKENAIHMITEFTALSDDSVVFRDIKKRINAAPNDDIATVINALDRKEESSTVVILNIYEKIALCIDSRWACETMLREFFKEMIVSTWNTFERYIKQKRRREENDGLFAKLEWLAKRWG